MIRLYADQSPFTSESLIFAHHSMKNLPVVKMTTKTILLIHNQPNMGELIHACLTDFGGWEVLVASSSLEGLKQAKLSQLDAIIFDFSITQMNALLLAKQLRENPMARNIPVVLLRTKEKWVDFQPFQQYEVTTITLEPSDLAMLPVMIAVALGW